MYESGKTITAYANREEREWTMADKIIYTPNLFKTFKQIETELYKYDSLWKDCYC